MILINNGIGFWIWGYSRATGHAADHYDYEIGFVYLIVCGIIATWVAYWFSRQVNSGRLIKHGVLEATQATGS